MSDCVCDGNCFSIHGREEEEREKQQQIPNNKLTPFPCVCVFAYV